MPPLPSPGAVIRVKWLWQVGTDVNTATIRHLSYTGTTPTGATLNTICSSMYTGMVSHLLPYLHPDNNLLGLTLQDLSSSTGAVGEGLVTNAGTRSGGPLPAEVAAIANYGIARHYRGGKPRSYLPFGTDTDVSAPQTWTSGFQSGLQGALEAMLTVELASGASGLTFSQPVNVSYYHGFTVVTSPTTGRARNVPTVRGTPLVDVITSIGINPKFGSQRRRSLH